MNFDMFWGGPEGPLRVATFGILSYAFLILILRLTGKRTLSKMNAFDFVITVACGSTFATVLLNKKVTFAEGATAFTVLVLMQYLVATASARSERVERVVKSAPTILVWQGEIQKDVLVERRVTHAEVLAACRSHGIASVSQVYALVLETAGDFTLVSKDAVARAGGADTVKPVRDDSARGEITSA